MHWMKHAETIKKINKKALRAGRATESSEKGVHDDK